MPANRQAYPRAERVGAILDAACVEFGERGFDRTTIAAIARRSGMTSANVHYYYETKDRLFVACVERAYDLLFADLETEPDPIERLHRYVEFHASARQFRNSLYSLASINPKVEMLLRRRGDWVTDTVAMIAADALSITSVATIVAGLLEMAPTEPGARTILVHAVARLT